MSVKSTKESNSSITERYSRFTKPGKLSAIEMAEICKIKGSGPACSYMFTDKELQEFIWQLIKEN